MGLPVERTCYSLSLAVASVSVVVNYDFLPLGFCWDVMWCGVVLIEQTLTHNHHRFSELWLCIRQALFMTWFRLFIYGSRSAMNCHIHQCKVNV